MLTIKDNYYFRKCLLINTFNFKEEENEITLSDKFLKFGNKAIIITYDHFPVFAQRLESVLNDDPNVFSFHSSKVEYVPNSHSGQLGIFRKFEKFSWQHEYRLRVQQTKNSGEAFQLKLGDLNGLVTVMDTKDMIGIPIIKK